MDMEIQKIKTFLEEWNEYLEQFNRLPFTLPTNEQIAFENWVKEGKRLIVKAAGNL